MDEKPKVYALYGGVSSGKTTLGKALSKHFGDIPHIDSDDVREELTKNRGGRSPNVFETMHNRALGHLAGGSSVVLSSTGMSPKYRDSINKLRSLTPTHVIQLNCDPNKWKEREGLRDDRWSLENGIRKSFEMPQRAYEESNGVDLKPDLKIDTSNMHPDDVFKTVVDHINNNPK